MIALADRLKIAAATFRGDGHVSLPSLLEEAAAALAGGAVPAPARAPVGALRITNWPTGPEYAFDPVETIFTLPAGEYPLYADNLLTKGST